jgi:hypothetical protein
VYAGSVTCPSDEDLARAAGGEVISAVTLHLAACEACRGIVDAVRASETAVDRPKSVDSAEPVPGMSIGRYVILRRLGRGGMGVVFHAYDGDRDRMVALKLMSGGGVERFKREFRAVRDLHHPNLVRLDELFADSGSWFFTMELIRGVDLLSYVRDERGCDIEQLTSVVIQVVRGLAALHRAGVVHRDVKPHNILVEPGGRAVVLDFGVVYDQTNATPEQGGVVGTVSYMAPEQIRGEAVGPAADWYALGVTLFVALTDRLPFTGSPADIMEAKLAHDGPAPSTVSAALPPQLDRLCTQLLSRNPDARPDVDAILRALGTTAEPEAVAATPFVGREGLLAALTAHVQTSRSSTVIVTLEGESGVGKTTLVDHVVGAWRARDPELVVLRARCHARELIPYNAFDGIVDDLARVLDRDRIGGHALDDLARLFPTLAHEPLAPALDPIAARRRAFAAFREVMHRLAQNRGVVLVIDDLQWADADSLAALEALIVPNGPPPILIVITIRTPTPPSWEAPSWLKDGARYRLAGFNVDEVAAFASALGHDGVDHARLREETGGNPMLLEQWLSTAGSIDPTTPVTLATVIGARTIRLSRRAAIVLDTLAAAGRAVSHEVACAATQLSADEVDAAVAELAAMRFARRNGTRSNAIDAFHERIRDEVYQALGPRAAALHAQLGEALIATDGPPDAIATQLALAGQRLRARRYARIAAEAAERALAFDRAAELYRQAIDVDERDAQLGTQLAGALANAGRPLDAGDAYLAAAAAASLPAERTELRRRAAEQYLAGGYLERGLTEARLLLAETGGGRLPQHDAQAMAALLVDRMRIAIRPLRWQSRAERDIPQEVLTRLDLHWSLSIGLASVDSLRGAVFSVRLPLLCLDHGEELRITRALCAAAVSYAGIGLRKPTRRLIAAAHRAAESHRSHLARFYAGLAKLSFDFLIENDWRATRDGGERLVSVWHQAGRGRGWELDTLEQWMSFAELWLGKFRAVKARIDAIATHAADAGNRFQEVGLRAYFGVLDTLLGDPERCEHDVAVAMARSREDRSNLNQSYWALRSRTYAAMYRGDVEDASQHLDPAWDEIRSALLLRVPTVAAEAHAAMGGYAVTRAALARNRGDRLRHLATAQRAARRLRRNPLFAGRYAYQTLAAGIAHVAGNDELALELLRAAEKTYGAAAMEGQVAATRMRLATLLGGSEGERLRADALAWFARERIPDPDRTTALLSPGWHPGA